MGVCSVWNFFGCFSEIILMPSGGQSRVLLIVLLFRKWLAIRRTNLYFNTKLNVIESTEGFHSRLCHSAAKSSYITHLPLRLPLSEEFVSNKEFRAELTKLTAALLVYWACYCPQTLI